MAKEADSVLSLYDVITMTAMKLCTRQKKELVELTSKPVF